MRPSEYELYRAIVEAGSLSVAARNLHISNAMVSKRLADLERRLGTQLILRTTHQFSLTPEGRAFYEDVKLILSAIYQAEEKVSGVENIPAGRLRVSAPTSFGRLHVAPYLLGFMEAYPQIELDFDLSDDFIDIRHEGIDIAIRITSEVTAGLDSVRLGDSHRILCAAPSYIKKNGRPESIEELNEHHLLAATGQMPWRMVGPKGVILVSGQSRVRTNSSEIVRELTIVGSGIALRSLWDITNELKMGHLVRVLPDYKGSSNVGVFAVWPKAEIIPAAIKVFTAYLETVLKTSLNHDTQTNIS
ncbi:MAG: LysR family transcriptional regulator [Emcibacter sp.]|nr:LysR family transcriptional regulator [Emcibacter sp.]